MVQEQGITLIVFSKDRPAQLDMLLRSIFLNSHSKLFKEVVVVVRFGNDFIFGYEKCMNLHPNVKFYIERGFDKTLRNVLSKVRTNHVCFMVDDNYMYRTIDEQETKVIHELIEKNESIFSLRLGNNIVIQDQYTGVRSSGPYGHIDMVYNGTITWKWGNLNLFDNFGYPCSLDGNIFEMSDIQKCMLSLGKIQNPNILESKLLDVRHYLSRNISCFRTSKLVNFPLNRVQKVAENKSGQIYPLDTKTACQKFLDGYQLKPVKDVDSYNACHKEVALKWTSR